MHHLIGKLLGKLLESILGKEIMLNLCGGMFALFGGVWLIVCILSIRESLRRRRTPEIWKPLVALPFAAALAVLPIWLLLSPDQRSAEERASAEIKELKGEVTVDAKAPGRPIIKVDFRDSYVSHFPLRRLSDKDLARLKPHLEALSQLRELDLCHADITDRGLSELRGLTQLKTLILGGQWNWPPKEGLTSAAVSELRKALPNTEIYFY